MLEHLGDAYRAAGRTADAEAAWRRALGSFGDEPPAEQLRLRASLERKLSGVAAPHHQAGGALRPPASGAGVRWPAI